MSGLLFACVFLSMYAAYGHVEGHYHITSSPDAMCPQEPCLTLPRFAADYSRYYRSDTELSLIFLPGNHILDCELSLAHIGKLSMITTNNTVFVNCAGSSGRFTISNTACLFIKGLHFVCCGGSTVSQVEDLVVEDTIFEGVEERGTALTLVGVSFAIIARSPFLFNSHLNNNSEDLIQTTIKNDLDFFVNYYLEQNVSFSTGGALFVANSKVVIESSTFWKKLGGVLFAHNSSISHFSSTFSYNNAEDGAVMATSQSSLDVKNRNFSGNVAEYFGGVMLSYKDSYIITSTNCQNNSAGSTGGVVDANHSIFNITDSSFTDNFAKNDGGVIYILDSFFNMNGITCRNNAAYGYGGVIFSDASNYHIVSSIFSNNSASFGGVFEMYRASVYLVNCTFTYNNARNDSGVIWCVDGSVGIDSSRSSRNRAGEFGGIMVTSNCSIHAADTIFDNNLESMYIFNSRLTFHGHTSFKHCSESPDKIVSKDLTTYQEGGAITSFKSTIAFIDTSSLTNNQARHGGAILTTDSTIIIYGNIRIANNTAISGSGGGISLRQSNLKITGHCYISHNKATRGGGIHVHSSYVTVYQPAFLYFINNSAIYGDAICLEVNPKLYLLKNLQYPPDDKLLSFISNNGNYGGAVYVEDNTNSDACLSNRDCFIQALTDAPDITDLQSHMNIIFSENTATEQDPTCLGDYWTGVFQVHLLNLAERSGKNTMALLI